MRADGHLDRYYRHVHNNGYRRLIVWNARRGISEVFLPELCYVSKSTWHETTAVFLRNAKFLLDGLARERNSFYRLAESVEKGLQHVRELRFENFSARSNSLELDDYRGVTVGPAF